MKRLFGWALAALTLTTLLASPSWARWSDPQDVKWVRQRSWNVQGLISYPDTAWTTIAASKVDTSAAFHFLDADLPGIGAFGKSAADSTQIGWIVIYGDSSATNTVNFKATTAAVQVNWGTTSVSWATAATYTSSQTDGTKFWAIPVFASLGATNDYGIDAAQTGWIFAPAVRVIVTGGSSAAVSAARIRVIKYKSSSSGGATTNW